MVGKSHIYGVNIRGILNINWPGQNLLHTGTLNGQASSYNDS